MFNQRFLARMIMRAAACSFILLNGVQVFGQQTQVDSLKRELKKKQDDTTYIKILNKLAEILPNGEWETYNEKMEVFALDKLKTAKGPAKKVFLGSLASAYNNKSLTARYAGEVSKAIKYGEKSLKLFEQLGDLHNLSTISFNNGQLYFSLGDINNAIASVQYALKLSRTHNKDLEIYCLNNLGFISKEQKEYDQAMKYHAAAYEIAKKSGNKEDLAYTLGSQGMLFADLEKDDEALKAFNEALALYIEIKNDQNTAAQYDNIGYIYEKQGDHARAHENFLKSLQISERLQLKMSMSATLNSLGRNLYLWGKEKEAETYFLKSLELSKQLGFPRHIYPPAEGLYRIYRNRNNTQMALEMYELSVQMKDSISNEETRKNTLRSQYQYEYEKKVATDSIQLLEAERLREVRIEKERAGARAQRYALIGGIVLLLVTGFFIFQRFRLKQRVKELKIRNKIASDLHDEVGSALSSISLLSGMAGQQVGTDNKTIRKIEETSRETLENMSDIVWSIQPRNDRLTDVVNRMRHYGQQLFSPMGIGFEFTEQGGLSDLPLNMEQRKNLYLVYKEALNNAAKYAGAQKINVSIASRSRNITLVIADDGKGFDTGLQREGNGLYTMQERAKTLDGTLDLESKPGSGTRVILNFKTT